MASNQHSEQGRNSAMDKTEEDRKRGDVFANQGGGKLGSGTQNSGHPANNVITSERRHDVNPDAPAGPEQTMESTRRDPADALDLQQRRDFTPAADVKGSGMPTLTGAGKLADDRPGRNQAKQQR